MGYFVSVEPGVHIYVEDVNPESRNTILFIHGWPASHHLFEYQFDELGRLGYRCIGLDTRGFGSSDKPAAGYGYDRLADDVRAVIETLKLQNITLAGHSMGGATAVRYMSRYNQQGVSKLALFGAAVPSVTQRPDFPYGVPREAITQLIDTARSNRPQMLDDFGRMFFFQNTGSRFNDWFFWMGIQAAGWATAQCAETFRDETLFGDLLKITVPTLILHGVHDQVCRYPLALAMKNSIQNARLVPFEYSGHGLFWEERDKFNRELVQFLG